MGKGTGWGFSIFMLIVIWLVFFGGWPRVVSAYHHWFNPKPPHHLLETGKGVGKIIEDLKRPVPGDSGRSVQ
jgi:hypothetical protein